MWVHMYVPEPKPGQATWLHGAPEACPRRAQTPVPSHQLLILEMRLRGLQGQKSKSVALKQQGGVGRVAEGWTQAGQHSVPSLSPRGKHPGVAVDPPCPGSQQLWAWLRPCPLHPWWSEVLAVVGGGQWRAVGSLAISCLGVK